MIYTNVVSASVIYPVTDSPKPGHSESIDYNLITLKLLIDAGKYTLPSCFMDKHPVILLLCILDSLPCVVLFHSLEPVRLA